MSIEIKPMESDDEIRGKAYVHWKSWQEAYAGLVDQAYLENLTLEKCTDIAFRWPDNLLVAKDGQKVVGFVGYGPSSDDALPETGEIFSIYILQEYYDKKIGYALMSAAVEKLSAHILTSAKIFQFLPVTCRISGRHATGRKENLTAREYKKIAVWVLEGNRRAIKFYERYGFRFDGTRKQIMLGTENVEVRMILDVDDI